MPVGNGIHIVLIREKKMDLFNAKHINVIYLEGVHGTRILFIISTTHKAYIANSLVTQYMNAV